MLDLLAQGKIAIAQGMKKDYICNDGYTEEIFSRVIKLSGQTDWSRIDKFMHKEYGRQWQLWKYALGTTPDQDECRDVTGLREIYDDNTIIPDADKAVIRECTEYMSHDNITALFNIVFLCIKYFDEISPVTRLFMQETVSNSITEKIEYCAGSQRDRRIDMKKFPRDFLRACDMLGVKLSDKEIKSIQQLTSFFIL